jgi:prepilin peptidase CpaA
LSNQEENVEWRRRYDALAHARGNDQRGRSTGDLLLHRCGSPIQLHADRARVTADQIEHPTVFIAADFFAANDATCSQESNRPITRKPRSGNGERVMFSQEVSSPMADLPAVCVLVSMILIVAAIIDGWKLKVPNWVTFPMVFSGWAFSAYMFGWEGLVASLIGTAVGLALLLPLYAIGGMGAGDVKLLAGVGAWVWGWVTLYAFCFSAVIGGLIAVGMVVYHRKIRHHTGQFMAILTEIWVVRDPNQLSAMAAERKSTMMLLPYGIPIAIGTITYFACMGLLL